MWRVITLLPVLALAAACGTSGTTSTTTVTATVTTGAASSMSDSSPATSSAATGAAPDACSLLTPVEAVALAGTPLDKPVGVGSGSGPATLCQYGGPTSGPTAQVEVYVGDGALKQLEIDRDSLGHKFTTVAGIGDQCFQEENFIFAKKGSLWTSVRLVLLNDPALNVKPLQTAMKQVVARLP